MSTVFKLVLLLSVITFAQSTHYINGKWYSCNMTEYNSKGKEIYSKTADGNEQWIEYNKKGYEIGKKSKTEDIPDTLRSVYDLDKKGNIIHSESSPINVNTWYEYNKDGKLIRQRNETGTELLIEYDKKGNKIHSIISRHTSKQLEIWYDYDNKGNMIHSKSFDDTENWYDYDNKGNEVHSKSSNGTEVWSEYDNDGHLVHTKSSDGSEKFFLTFKEKTKTGYKEYQCTQE